MEIWVKLLYNSCGDEQGAYMKAQRLLICVSLLIMVLSVSCFSPWRGDEGNLTIVWGKSAAARAFKNDLDGCDFMVTLTGPGDTQERIFRQSVPSATFTVTPGTWTVTIKGGYLPFGQTGGNVGSIDIWVMGVTQVEVTPGKNAPKTIPMYTATTVNSWAQLDHLVKSNNEEYSTELIENNRSREELFILGESFNSFEEDYYYDYNLVTDTWEWLPGTGATIYINRPIIIIAEDNVTIGRSTGSGMSYFYSFFNVEDGGTLTLGLPGMAGTLTFDNQGEESSSLMKVGSGGTLVMNSGVAIKNGFFPEENGGVLVDSGQLEGDEPLPGGTFIMNGGTITDNHVKATESYPIEGGGPFIEYSPGGGVVVRRGYFNIQTGKSAPDGRFIRNGGTISGNTPDNVY